MRILPALFIFLFFPAISASAAAIAEYKLFTILEGFTQKSGKTEKFSSHTYQTGPSKTDRVEISGQAHDLRYTLNKGTEAPGREHILRNFGAAVQQNGGIVLFEKHNDAYYRLQQQDMEIWVHLSCAANGGWYYLNIIEKKAMKQEVTINKVIEDLDSAGRATVYINFDTASAVIKPESDSIITEIQELLLKRPLLRLSIEGHTDNTGTAASNRQLSAARAAAVKAKLVELGIPANRIQSTGHGQDQPVADNGTEEGRAKNRRVELVKING